MLYELSISGEVLSGTQSSDETDVIAIGKKITVHIFEASSPDSPLAYSRLQYGDETKWVIQREGKTPTKVVFESDGVSVVKIICSNGCSDDYYFNAYAKIGVK